MLNAGPQVTTISMSGKAVLITGATSGLGLATALLLAEQGAEVVIVGHDRTRSNVMRAEIAKCAAGSVSLAGLWAMSEALYESLQGVIANRLGKEVSMEDRNDIHYDDDALDRELNALVREMEQEEVIRRTVIEMLVMLGSDAMLEHDV